MFDPKTGKVRIRTVDRSLAYFHVARDFQVRLTLEDFENEEMLKNWLMLQTPHLRTSKKSSITSWNGKNMRPGMKGKQF
jgi:hypothetical protein